MKTRNGFVSNSSSSSFVVAFPHAPKSSEDVQQMMFGTAEGEVKLPYDDYGMSFDRVAEEVWARFNPIRIKATKKLVIDEFDDRYTYYPANGGVRLIDRSVDEFGGTWYYPKNQYCRRNVKVSNQLRALSILREELRQERSKEQRDICAAFPKKQPPYAYRGAIGGKGKDMFTSEQISAYETWRTEFDAYLAAHKRYQELVLAERNDDGGPLYKKERALSRRLAREDATYFWKKNSKKKIYMFMFSDNHGESPLEHGDIFRNLEHVWISHH